MATRIRDNGSVSHLPHPDSYRIPVIYHHNTIGTLRSAPRYYTSIEQCPVGDYFIGVSLMSNKYFSKDTIRKYIRYTQPKARSFTVLVADSIEAYNYSYFKGLSHDEAMTKAKSVGSQYSKGYKRVSLSIDQTVRVVQSSNIVSSRLEDIKRFVKYIYDEDERFNTSIKKEVIKSIGSKAGIANPELVPDDLCKYKIGEISLSIFMYGRTDNTTIQVSRHEDEVLYKLYKHYKSNNGIFSIDWGDFEYLVYDPLSNKA